MRVTTKVDTSKMLAQVLHKPVIKKFEGESSKQDLKRKLASEIAEAETFSSIIRALNVVLPRCL